MPDAGVEVERTFRNVSRAIPQVSKLYDEDCYAKDAGRTRLRCFLSIPLSFRPILNCHSEERSDEESAFAGDATSYDSAVERRISVTMALAARSTGCSASEFGPRSKALTSARPSIIRLRTGPSGRISLSRATTFSAVKSRWTSSGTISFPAIKFGMAKYGTLTRERPRK